MRAQALALGVATAGLLALGACDKDNGKTASGAPKVQTEKAQKVAGTKTIGAGSSGSASSRMR